MRKLKFIILLSFLFIALSGCKGPTPIDGKLLKEKWVASSQNSAVSWWYLGENKEQYFISEKWPTEEVVYIVSKDMVMIKGVNSVQFDSGIEPVNLKESNVIFK